MNPTPVSPLAQEIRRVELYEFTEKNLDQDGAFESVVAEGIRDVDNGWEGEDDFLLIPVRCLLRDAVKALIEAKDTIHDSPSE